jgi:anti-anti-sigma factor
MGRKGVLKMYGADAVLTVEGPLRAPVDCVLRSQVKTLLDRGARHIVLNLDRVPGVDAAGVGELVRLHNTAAAAGGVLRVYGARAHVRELLSRVGLYELLHADTQVAA